MPAAKSTLEALLVNDPEHPAIREFIVKVKDIVIMTDAMHDIKADAAAFHFIKYELGSLEKRLLC